MIDDQNSVDVSIGLGLLEGRLRVAKENLARLHKSLAYLHNITDNTDLKHDIIDISHALRKTIDGEVMHFGKLSYDKAEAMMGQIKGFIVKFSLYKRRLTPELLQYVSRVVADLNEAKDLLQAVINKLTIEFDTQEEQTQVAAQAAAASQT